MVIGFFILFCDHNNITQSSNFVYRNLNNLKHGNQIAINTDLKRKIEKKKHTHTHKLRRANKTTVKHMRTRNTNL